MNTKQKSGKRVRSVTKGHRRNLEGTTEGIESKSVFRKSKKGRIVRKEKVNVLAGSDKRIEYEDATGYTRKGVISHKKKTVKNKEGEYTKRKEKIIYEDGKSMKKRKQKKIRFGKNKGKIRSKTVSWKDGKRTVKKNINSNTRLEKWGPSMDRSKLQKGGFHLEPGIESID